ncbi:MAG: Hsp33 family molecular chaperone HslO [Rhodocyclaceae bacterium]|nr:Hsp33 family molecular chaperone HslO [Rhodocyclaceae bacterium]
MLRDDSFAQAFLFDALDIRGVVVQINDAWRAMLTGRRYTPQVRKVLGELAAVTTMITGTLKQPGRLTFQMKGHGELSLLVVDCTESLNLRGYAQASQRADGLTLPELLGDGQMLLTLDIAARQQPYQSHVPREGDTIAAVFENFLIQSEQHPAALWLAANGDTAAGLFLQKLPGADQRDPDGWARITQLAATVTDDELRTLDPATLLTRLFHEEDVRLFDPRPVTHHWPADHGKIDTMLRDLGREELDAIIAEHGVVEIHDDLSNHTYRYDADAVAALFADPPVPPTQH